VGLPPGIVEKEGILTTEERATMQEHAAIGERILLNVAAYEGVARVVRAHHERVDGNGYPDGLPLHEIPLLSRIIAVADAYNAMTSGRSYRSAMRADEARRRLRDAAGTQFDDLIVRAFDSILEAAAPTYLTAARADFAIEAQKATSRTKIVLDVAA
jgi:HD-GYP domain-containing protein (c-di-GMP phosphodiesterase class II)